MDHHEADCIVFDLGGVVVDIDINQTFANFVKHSNNPLDINELGTVKFFHDFERGHIEPGEFISNLNDLLGADLDRNTLIDIWNGMIIDVPLERLELVRKIGEIVPVYAFSNTNVLHIDYLDDMINSRHGHNSLAYFFNEVYYSYQMGHRKPDPESFQWILERGGMAGKNVLFLDDNLTNIDAAEQAGMRGWHITSPGQWIDYFTEWKK